jgi:type I restriction enzyme S subunit
MLQDSQWQEVSLKYLFSDRTIGAWGSEPENENEGIICIRAADFITDQIRHSQNDLTKRKYDSRDMETRQLQFGDLIIEKSGGGDNQPVGRVVSFELNETALCSNFLERLRPDSKTLYSRFGAYLLYFLWSSRRVIPFVKQTTGIQNLDAKEYFSQVVKVPSLSLQKEIANYLDWETERIDALIKAKEQLLVLLDEKRRALVTHAVTRGLNPTAPTRDSGVEWLGHIPVHWKISRLKFLIFGIDTGFSPQCYNFPAQQGGWGVVKTGCVNGGIFNPIENKALPPEIEPPLDLEVKAGDILMSRASGSMDLIGSVALVEKQPSARLLLSDKTFRLNLDLQICDQGFFVNTMGSYLLRQQILQMVSGAAGLANNISQANIGELLLPLPPIVEQRAISSYIKNKTSVLEALKSATQKTIAFLQERRTALITAAVTGQISIPESSWN